MQLSDWKFGVFIITHGRPDLIITDRTLRRSGYTGPIYYVIDDEDATADQYKATFGELVIQFNKKQYAEMVDEGDNFNNRRTTTHARNACFDIAIRLGLKWFLVLDDDYTKIELRTNEEGQYPKRPRIVTSKCDEIICALLQMTSATNAACIAMMQGGDFIGGENCSNATNPKLLRKAMNSFLCSTSRRFWFISRLNEDVNTYCTLGSRGVLMGTIPLLSLTQRQTQGQAGGMTEAYLQSGTYVKSFTTVMYCPSFARVSALNTTHSRIHHRISWPHAVPVIVPDSIASHHAKQQHKATRESAGG